MMFQTLRTLRRDWIFSTVAVAILGVGIAANTSVFTLMNTILFKPLPYEQPQQQLVVLEESLPELVPGNYPFSAPDVGELRKRARSLSELAASTSRELDLSGSIEPTRVDGARLEAQAWKMIGVAPMMGQTYTVEEDLKGERLIVLSYQLWKRLFGGDPNVIGRVVDVDRRAHTITAVMPKGFDYPPHAIQSEGKLAEAWVPMSFTQDELAAVGDNFGYKVIGRIAEGVGPERLRADLARTAGEIRAGYPADFPRSKLVVASTPLLNKVVGDVGRLFGLLAACVAGVLLIGCANIASLMLAKAVGRQQEFAIRKALGASTWLLMRQSFEEAILLALPGAALGLLLSSWAIDVLVNLAPVGMPRLEEVSIDWRVAVFTLGLSLVSAILFAMAPAWHASRTQPGPLRGGSKGGSQTRSSLRMGHALVSIEVALCFMLLGATGLLIETYRNLLNADPGFAPRKLITFEIAPPSAAYGEGTEQRKAFFERIDRKLEELPGLEGFSYADSTPLDSGWQRIFLLEGQAQISARTPQMTHHSLIAPGHIHNIGARLVRGREFLNSDREGSLPVCLINESMARQFFPGTDPIGRRLKFGGPNASAPLDTIVGVVRDVKARELNESGVLQTYHPMLQHPARARTYFLRAGVEPAALASVVHTAIQSLDSSQVVARFQTMEQVIDAKAASRKFQMLLLSVFGAAALLLASTGILGVIANTLQRQTKEIGIRMALGAEPMQTLTLVLRRAMQPVAAGLALGLIGLFAAGKSLESFLYGVQPGDPLTLLIAGGVMLLAAIAAMYLPARRAISVNPSIALRAD